MIISDKMTSSRCKINQYNWFGQKLLTQHRYDDILRVRDHLSGALPVTRGDPTGRDEVAAVHGNERLISDHLNYLSGLALMKTSTCRLEELITTLQKLNFQKSSQYFLLLCQCLLYLGNHDSVVAICKQVLNREIDTISSSTNLQLDDNAENANEASVSDSTDLNSVSSHAYSGEPNKQQDWCLQSIWEESIEFKKIFHNVNKNRLINDPRLWFTFATSLELQFQLKDADLAYRVASKLASGQAKQFMPAKKAATYGEENSTQLFGSPSNSDDCEALMSSVDISGYYMPHTKYAEFCVRYRDDYKTAIQVLNQANIIQQTVVNYHLNPALALTLCAQRNSNSNHFAKANEILQALDNHSVSTRNPSFVYNQIALKCKQKLYYIDTSLVPGTQSHEMNILDGTSDEKRLDLNYALIKSYVLINDIVNNSSHDPMLYKSQIALTTASSNSKKTSSKSISAQIDKTIDTLRNCDSSCWLSHSLWNNLGVCYLMKRRYIASLSCLIKAHRLNPLDWRINYNLSLAFLHVDLTVRALSCSMASKNFYNELAKLKPTSTASAESVPRFSSLVNTLLASCYSGLGLKSEARRFYSEMMALGRMNSACKAPVLTFVNYLLLLHRTPGSASDSQLVDDEDSKLICRLLDQLEQAWLQRNPNDTQFTPALLETARLIGDALQEQKPQMKKIYAWTKCNQ